MNTYLGFREATADVTPEDIQTLITALRERDYKENQVAALYFVREDKSSRLPDDGSYIYWSKVALEL